MTEKNICNEDRNTHLVFASKDTYSVISEINMKVGKFIVHFFGGQQDSGTLLTHRTKAKNKEKKSQYWVSRAERNNSRTETLLTTQIRSNFIHK